MDRWVCIFIAVCVSSLIWPTIPSATILSVLIFLALLCLGFPLGRFPSRGKHLSAILAAIIWIGSVGHWQMRWQLPLQQTRQVVVVEGQIASLVKDASRVNFNLWVERFDSKPILGKALLRISWFEPDFALKQGNKVRLEVKIKPPHGLANEGGFHYQQWLFSEGIQATGYVRKSEQNLILDPTTSWRQRLAERFWGLSLDNAAWLSALSFGYRGDLQTTDWDLLQRSGLAHLVAISGLHLGIVASVCVALLARLFGRLLTVAALQNYNAQRLACLFALLLTALYVNIAGQALPSVRAWLMGLLVLILSLSYRYWRPTHILLYSFFIFLFCFPLALFGISLWLSFTAIGVLCFVLWRWPDQSGQLPWQYIVLSSIRLQCSLTLLMLPLIAYQFGIISLVSPLLNLIAVPIVTLFLVPLCLLATVILVVYPGAAAYLFSIADVVLTVGIKWTKWACEWTYSVVQVSPMPIWVWGLTVVGLILCMLPVAPVKRSLCVIFVIPVIGYALPERVGGWRVDVLDVGQGSAVLISQGNRAILYDVGASYPSGFNMADAVILPLLAHRGIKQLDAVVLSHFDNDHAGSWHQLNSQIEVKQRIDTRNLCRTGWHKYWLGIRFEVLWPSADPQYGAVSGNNNSCVVMLDDGKNKVLLAGDIEHAVEAVLVEQIEALGATLLLAPHHGSKTSSTLPFVQAVNARYVVFSQGFLNRWGFPVDEVVKRYQRQGAQIFKTADSGQVSFWFDSEGQVRVQTFRQAMHPYWYANTQDQ